MATKKISLFSAILICINIMFGAGIFLAPTQLARLVGPFGIIGYLISALILFPLILTIAELARLQPVSGGLYVYSREYISPLFGFLCGWSYFIAKSTSIAFLVHTVNTYFQARIPFLQVVSPLTLDYAAISFLTLLTIAGVSIGSKIQYLFIVLKMLPMLFACCAGFICFQVNNMTTGIPETMSIFATIPVCLYALTGFEAICAIGGFIENGSRNIRIALLTSFSTVALLAITYQIISYGALGSSLALTKEPIRSIGSLLFPTLPQIGALFNGIAFSSIVAGAFSMTGTNCWNLHTIAKNNHLPGSALLTQVTKTNTPWVALLVQASLSLLMITIATEQLPLQNMVTFSIFCAFFLTALAAYRAAVNGFSPINKAIPIISMMSCFYVIGLCFFNIMNYGISLPFLTIFFSGCLLTYINNRFCTQK